MPIGRLVLPNGFCGAISLDGWNDGRLRFTAMPRSRRTQRSKFAKGCGWLAAGFALIFTGGVAIAVYQARRSPTGIPVMVAMGSSFAAGAALGNLQPESPWLCARSVNGYPQRLARMKRLSIVDRSCGGATASNLLSGGQFFQPAQVAALSPETRLVTLTVGGNDVGYIGDLSLLAARRSGSLFGKAVAASWNGPSGGRDWGTLQANLQEIIREIRRRSPNATIVVATYPAILPSKGNCSILSLSDDEVKMMRAVGDQLASVTREVAEREGAALVDMHQIGASHNACSRDPWTFGWDNAGAAPFHPTNAGAEATARAIASAIEVHQQL